MARLSVSYVFLALFPLLEAACYVHMYLKRDDIRIRKRSKAVIYVTSSAGWLAYFNLIVSVLGGGIPCGALYVVSLLVAAISMGPQIVRALTFRGTMKYSQLVTQEEISSRAQRKKSQRKKALSVIMSSDLSERGEGAFSPKALTKITEANLVMVKTRRAANRASWALLVVPTLLVILCLALTSGESQLFETDFALCYPEPTYFQYASPAFGLASIVLAWVVMTLVDKIEDEIGLRREIQRNAALLGLAHSLLIIMRLAGHLDWHPVLQAAQQTVLSLSMAMLPFLPGASVVDAASSWARKRINPATKSALPGYAQSLPKGRTSVGGTSTVRGSIQQALGGKRGSTRGSMASTHGHRESEVSASWDAGLCILLSTEEGIDLFSQHCAREFSSENVRFWCAVNDYKAKFDVENSAPLSTEVDGENSDDEKSHDGTSSTISQTKRDEGNDNIQDAAREVYRSFIDHPSKTQINLSFKQKIDIKNAIDSGQIRHEMFDAAQREIFALMSRDSYPRFLASKKSRLHLT